MAVIPLFKAVWSTAYKNSLPDSSFLLILPGGKKDSEGKTTPRNLRMFPYKDANGKIDLPHLRNAIARIPHSNRIDQATKSRLQARARRILATRGGEKSGVYVFKDSTGQWWFYGVYSNKYKDRDDEILSEESHKEYIGWLDSTGFKPVITGYHHPRMPVGFWPVVYSKYKDSPKILQKIVDYAFREYAVAKAHKVFYLGGLTHVLAKFLPGKEKIAEHMSGVSELGMSHGFIVNRIENRIIDEYRTFEMSVLKRRRAANLLTFATTLVGGKKMAKGKGLAPADRAELVEVFGEEAVIAIEAQADKNEKALDGLIAFKDVIVSGEESETEDDKAKKPMMDEEDMEHEDDEEDEKSSEKSEETPTLEVVAAEAANTFKQVHDAITRLQSEVQSLTETTKQQAEEITALKGQLEEKNKQIEEVKKSDDEKIAAHYFTPLNWQGGYSASRDSKNVVKESEKEELTENQPVGENKPDPDNPLALGFWNQLSTALNRG